MNVVYCEDYENLSRQAAELVIAEIEERSNLLLCAAGGNSPSGLYNELAEKAEADRKFFAELSIVMLDEWGGLTERDPGSAAHYLRRRLLDPLGIPPERYISFASGLAEPNQECERVRSELAQRGQIDLCVLGLGVNGHIGFNEPAPFLLPYAHVAHLSAATRRHSMVRSMDRKPDFGVTLGMQEILASRRIILLVAGDNKDRAVTALLSEKISTYNPASFLWLHGNVDCLIDRTALGERGKAAAE
jgi:galactosamine-6-phosphate isomerase